MSRPAFIETFTGRRFQPLDPDPLYICIEDIAHALSQQCRFTGHTRVHYSVAEHSVRVAELLASWGATQDEQLWGLLHDASEAYLVDIPSPLKCMPEFAPYREAETCLMGAVCDRFGLVYVQPPKVTLADAVMLATEARDLMPHRPEHWIGLKEAPLPGVIVPWTATQAEREFLHLFGKLRKEAGK